MCEQRAGPPCALETQSQQLQQQQNTFAARTVSHGHVQTSVTAFECDNSKTHRGQTTKSGSERRQRDAASTTRSENPRPTKDERELLYITTSMVDGSNQEPR